MFLVVARYWGSLTMCGTESQRIRLQNKRIKEGARKRERNRNYWWCTCFVRKSSVSCMKTLLRLFLSTPICHIEGQKINRCHRFMINKMQFYFGLFDLFQLNTIWNCKGFDFSKDSISNKTSKVNNLTKR